MSIAALSKLGYSVEEAMKLMGLSRQTFYNEINNGHLRSFKVGKRRLVSPDALRDWVLDREAATAKGAA